MVSGLYLLESWWAFPLGFAMFLLSMPVLEFSQSKALHRVLWKFYAWKQLNASILFFDKLELKKSIGILRNVTKYKKLPKSPLSCSVFLWWKRQVARCHEGVTQQHVQQAAKAGAVGRCNRSWSSFSSDPLSLRMSTSDLDMQQETWSSEELFWLTRLHIVDRCPGEEQTVRCGGFVVWCYDRCIEPENWWLLPRCR